MSNFEVIRPRCVLRCGAGDVAISALSCPLAPSLATADQAHIATPNATGQNVRQRALLTVCGRSY